MAGRIDSSLESGRHGPGSAPAELSPHRSAEFAALMFEALDSAFAALGHPDPVDHLRRLADARRAARPANAPTAGREELAADFATDILLTAAHYAALLDTWQNRSSDAAAADDDIAA